MGWVGGAREDRNGIFEEMILELKPEGQKKSTTHHMVQGRGGQAKGMENTGSAGQEDLVVSEEVIR